MKAVTQKPLLDSHLTVEDFAIWLSLASRFEHLRRPFGRPALLPADRRDAELMLEAQSARWCELSLVTGWVFKPDTVPYLGTMCHQGIDVGGDITRFV